MRPIALSSAHTTTLEMSFHGCSVPRQPAAASTEAVEAIESRLTSNRILPQISTVLF